MSSTVDAVKAQYELFPYPRVSWFARPHKLANIHAHYEVGSALVHRKINSCCNKKIALLGSGTLEPQVFAASHPQSKIYACELSEKTIGIARRRCKLAQLKNIEFYNQSLSDFSNSINIKFDYIHCFGVLHHLPNLNDGFAVISNLLEENGFARIMVYSKSSRQRIKHVQRMLKLLGMDVRQKNFRRQTAKLMAHIPDSHPLKLTYLMHPEIRTKQGLGDSFLHPFELSPSLDQLEIILKNNGLFLHKWDFSENAFALLDGAEGHSVVEKIKYLEAFDQWPLNFTFWVSKVTPLPDDRLKSLALSPLFKHGFKYSSFYSTLLRRRVSLTGIQKRLLKKLETRTISILELSKIETEAAITLLKCRLILEVNSS